MSTKLDIMVAFQTNFAVRAQLDPGSSKMTVSVVAKEGDQIQSDISFTGLARETDGQPEEAITLLTRQATYHALVFALENLIDGLESDIAKLKELPTEPSSFPQSGGASA